MVYYGTSPETARLAKVRAPVLGLYGGDDARVDQTIPALTAGLPILLEKPVAPTVSIPHS